MNRFHAKATAASAAMAVIASMALSGAVHAQDKNSPSSAKQQRSQDTMQPTAQTQQDAQRAPTIVIGELVATRDVDLEGNTRHRLLKLQPRQGDSIVVDIGTPDPAATKDLQPGDRVIAVGRSGRINDQPVLFARNMGELYSAGLTESSVKGTSAEQSRER